MPPPGSFAAPGPRGRSSAGGNRLGGGIPRHGPFPAAGLGPPTPLFRARWGHGVVPSPWGGSGPPGGSVPWGAWGNWGCLGATGCRGLRGAARTGGARGHAFWGWGEVWGSPPVPLALPTLGRIRIRALTVAPAQGATTESRPRRRLRGAGLILPPPAPAGSGAVWGHVGPRGARHGRGACVGLCRTRCRAKPGGAHVAAPTSAAPFGDGGAAPCAPGTLLHRLPRLGSFPPPPPSPRGPRGVQGGGRPPRWPRCRDVGHPTRCCWPPERGAQGLCSRRHRWPWRALLLAWLSLGCGIGTAQVRARGHPRAGLTVPPQPPPRTSPSSTQGSAPEVLVQGPELPARARPRRQLARGTWGPWGPWSACSSSCGDGVAFRARRCLR